MNIFRLAGDMTHLLSIVVLLLKIRTMKSCAGISLKTQELYVIVFLTRYLDLFTRYISFYNTVMKLVFIGTSICIVWYMRYHKVVKQTYSKDQDTFRHYFLIPPCFLLALLIHRDFNVMEVLWTFSLYLEALAIIPQLVLLQTSRNIDNLTGNYIFFLGAYRALYLINWIYRFFMENFKFRWIPWISGLVQTALYADFFYYYIKSWKNHEKLNLGQIEGAFVQGIGFFMLEEYPTNSNGLVVAEGTWTYKIPTVDTIPKQFNVEILNSGHHKKRILSSKASGEPPLTLAVSVHCAIRAAIKEARQQLHSWGGLDESNSTFQLEVPATMPVVKELCGLDSVQRFLQWTIGSK